MLMFTLILILLQIKWVKTIISFKTFNILKMTIYHIKKFNVLEIWHEF